MLRRVFKPAILALPLAVSCGREPIKDQPQVEERAQTEEQLKLQAQLGLDILDEALARKLIVKYQYVECTERKIVPVFDGMERKFIPVDELYALGFGKVKHAFKNLEYLETLDFKALAETIRKHFLFEGITTERDYHLDVKLGMIPVLDDGVISHIKQERMLSEWIVSLKHALPKS